MLTLLLVDPAPELVTEIEALFGKGKATQLEIISVASLEAAMDRCRVRPPACAFVSSALLALEDRLELEQQIAGFGDVPVIVLAEPEHARAAPRVLAAGVDDWVPKGGPLFVGLPRFVAYALERVELRRHARELQARERDHERLFHALLDSTPAAVLVLDQEGRVAHCSRHVSELFGRPLNRIEGRRFADFLAPHSRRIQAELEEEALEVSGQESEVPVQLATLGEEQPIRMRVCVARSGNGRTWRIAWLTPDKPVSEQGELSHRREDALRRALREVLEKGSGALPMARIHLLGLGELRAALGERWTEFEAQVRHIVERVLRSHLEPGEHFCREEGLGYMIIFGAADEARATARIAAMEEAIRAAVLGAEELAERGRLQRPPLDGDAYERLAAVETSIDEIPVDAEDLATEGDLWEVLRARSRESGHADALHAAGIIAELRRTAGGSYEPALDRQGIPAPILLLAFDQRTAELIESGRRRAAHDPAQLLELDRLVLECHLRILIEELRMGSDVALVDVHYDTVASRHSGDTYIGLLEEIPEDLHPLLGFNVCSIPAGIYAPKLARLVSALRPFSRLQAIEVDIRRGELPDLPTLRVPMVTVPYPGLAGQQAGQGERLRTLANRAHACHTRVLLRQVPRGWGPVLRERFPIDFTCLA